MEAWLELGAKFTVLASLLVVVYFFATTTYRIARLPNQGWPLFHLWGGRQEVLQRPASLPFTFNLVDASVYRSDSFTFKLTLVGEGTPVIKCLWGIDANEVFSIINASTWDKVHGLEDAPTETSLAVQTLKIVRTDETELELTVDKPSSLDWNDLSGKYKYPLAMFISSLDDSASDIVGLCLVLHVKCELFAKPTAVLAQYIKLMDGRAHKLMPLFLPFDGEEQQEAQDNSSSGQTPFSTVLCSVCQTFPVSRAIVPCGHCCLCAGCFDRMTTCPICRGKITYFFKTRDEVVET